MIHCTPSIRTAARCYSPSASGQLIYGRMRRFISTRSTTTTRSHDKEHDARTDSFDTAGGWPHHIHASARTEAKKSIFVAHASRLPSASPPVLRAFLAHLTAQPALKRATHCMYAWRVASQVDSNTTLNSSAYTSSTGTRPSPGTRQVLTGQNDGGETGAGERLARLLEATSSANVIVVVSRWYGGVKLGSERWKMISGVAKDALAQGGFSEGKRPTDSDTSSQNPNVSGNKKKRKK